MRLVAWFCVFYWQMLWYWMACHWHLSCFHPAWSPAVISPLPLITAQAYYCSRPATQLSRYMMSCLFSQHFGCRAPSLLQPDPEYFSSVTVQTSSGRHSSTFLIYSVFSVCCHWSVGEPADQLFTPKQTLAKSIWWFQQNSGPLSTSVATAWGDTTWRAQPTWPKTKVNGKPRWSWSAPHRGDPRQGRPGPQNKVALIDRCVDSLLPVLTIGASQATQTRVDQAFDLCPSIFYSWIHPLDPCTLWLSLRLKLQTFTFDGLCLSGETHHHEDCRGTSLQILSPSLEPVSKAGVSNLF